MHTCGLREADATSHTSPNTHTYTHIYNTNIRTREDGGEVDDGGAEVGGADVVSPVRQRRGGSGGSGGGRRPHAVEEEGEGAVVWCVVWRVL